MGANSVTCYGSDLEDSDLTITQSGDYGSGQYNSFMQVGGTTVSQDGTEIDATIILGPVLYLPAWITLSDGTGYSFSMPEIDPVIGISLSNNLWFFGAGNAPPAGFTLGNVQTTLSVGGTSGGFYDWSITAGATKASFSSNSYQLVTTTYAPSVVLYSKNWSTSQNDVTISMVWTDGNGVVYPEVDLRLTVDSPYDLAPNGAPTSDGVAANSCFTGTPGNVGYLTKVPYTMRSFLGVQIAHQNVNEQFGAVQVNEQNNWTPYNALASSYLSPDGQFWDWICVSDANSHPQEKIPQIPLSGELVDSAFQTWSIGSAAIGQGVAVQTDTFQRYIDHGAHVNIVSPVSGR